MLCARLEEILGGQENFLGGCGSLRVEREAQHLAEQLLARQGAAPPAEIPDAGWLCGRSGLGELLDVDFEAMSSMRFHRAGDVLMHHRETLVAALFSRVSELFGLDWTVTLYDRK